MDRISTKQLEVSLNRIGEEEAKYKQLTLELERERARIESRDSDMKRREKDVEQLREKCEKVKNKIKQYLMCALSLHQSFIFVVRNTSLSLSLSILWNSLRMVFVRSAWHYQPVRMNLLSLQGT